MNTLRTISLILSLISIACSSFALGWNICKRREERLRLAEVLLYPAFHPALKGFEKVRVSAEAKCDKYTQPIISDLILENVKRECLKKAMEHVQWIAYDYPEQDDIQLIAWLDIAKEE